MASPPWLAKHVTVAKPPSAGLMPDRALGAEQSSSSTVARASTHAWFLGPASATSHGGCGSSMRARMEAGWEQDLKRLELGYEGYYNFRLQLGQEEQEHK